MQLLLFTSGFLSIALYHTQHQVPIYHRKFHKSKLYLYLHIITGITEAVRYRLHRFTNPEETAILPQPLDVVSCFVWSWTSLALVKTLRRGHPLTTRPPYQAAACLRPIISLISFIWSIPSLHKVSISTLNSFVYARLAIFFFCHTPYIGSSSSGSSSYGTIYAISIPLAATLSVHESRVPGASVVFVFATVYVAGLNRWVTGKSRLLRESKGEGVSKYEKMLVSGLIRMGFVELEELRIVEGLKELQRPVYDEYVEDSVKVV
ncbi:hypothetical protein N7456_003968 [Penicillium angulare]|uniref:Uncharacterized protein n=1 Tax=Penicillium angulare TaxID=116970 RepID=A0A9W9KJ49_9EURO|nr:hypothetical protein N7456_003968 [Penicillium angulare]